MSTVHVFVGQCGNQLGTAFLDSIASAAEASGNEEYQLRVSGKHFRPAMRPPKPRTDARTGRRQSDLFDKTAPLTRLPQPRCVMVDMEPKVIEEAIKRVNGCSRPIDDVVDEDDTTSAVYGNPHESYYCLAPQQCVTRGEGSANNWAYGYYQQGESRREAIAECLRRENESRESGSSIATYHVVHSVAGGTGSGVGCLVAEVVRDLYPHASLLHSVVWPFAAGEVVTQSLNAVLCMSNLKDAVDAVCVAYNDEATERLTQAQRLATSGGARRGKDASVNYDDVNRLIGRMWAPLHLPQLLYAIPPAARDVTKNRIQQESVLKAVEAAALPSHRRYACTEDYIELLALDPAKKFFTGMAVPTHATVREYMSGSAQGTSSWSAVLTDAARTSGVAFADTRMSGFCGRGALWMLRGRGARTEGMRALQDVMTTEPMHGLGALCVSPDDSPNTVGSPSLANVPSGRPLHEVTMYGHAAVIPASLKVALRRVEDQVRAGAFTYQFERYGVDKDTLRDATMRLWDTVYAYTGDA